MRVARPVVLAVLAVGLLLAAPTPVRADLVKENAFLTYNPGAKKWDFTAFSASGFITSQVRVSRKSWCS